MRRNALAVVALAAAGLFVVVHKRVLGIRATAELAAGR